MSGQIKRDGLQVIAAVSVCLGALTYLSGLCVEPNEAGQAPTKRIDTSAPGSPKTESEKPDPTRDDATASGSGHTDHLTEPGTVADETGKKVNPSSVVAVGGELFFLTPRALWRSPTGMAQLKQGATVVAHAYAAPGTISNIPVQELFALTYLPGRYCLVVLDKSGDLYEFDLKTNTWSLFRANLPFLRKQPDPDFVGLASIGTSIALLDPERNQIWKVPGSDRVLKGFFPDVLPWKVQKADAKLGDAAGIAFDGSIYVCTRHGGVTIYGDGQGKSAPQRPLPFTHPHNLRPSRVVTESGAPLYIVERENNRVLAIDKDTHRVRQFLFARGSDLRGLLPADDGFWILDRGKLVRRDLTKSDSLALPCHPRRIDSRLDGMTLPIEGMRLPRHVGVFPGARRLYRYGVHEGLDLFYDSGAPTKVIIGTPAIAALGGKVLRADANFKDMNAAQFARIMAECYRQHRTSPHNEDLFRGCQVWLDHGRHMMTRYAHLSKINSDLKAGDIVNKGDVIGFVGVSGTGQNLPGRTRFPHLHFEIWLDGNYLGYGLTPIETMATYEDIFGTK